MNSKRPNGVTMAVLATSSGSVVCTHEINFAEDSSTMEGCSEILNVRNRIAVGDGTRVQGMVITTRLPVPWSLLASWEPYEVGRTSSMR